MTLHEKLLDLFPGSPMGSWMIQDDGYGVYIAEWNLALPRPDAGAALIACLAARADYQTAPTIEKMIAWEDARKALALFTKSALLGDT